MAPTERSGEQRRSSAQCPTQCRRNAVVQHNRLERVHTPILETLKQDKYACGQCDADEQVNHPTKVGVRHFEYVTRMKPIGPRINAQLSGRLHAVWKRPGSLRNGRSRQTTTGGGGTPPTLDFIPGVLLQEVVEDGGATFDQQAGEVEFGVKPFEQGIEPFFHLPGAGVLR